MFTCWDLRLWPMNHPLKSGINNTPFHKHQQDGTITEYTHAPLSLLGMLVRPQKSYQVPLLKPVEQALTDMLSALAHDVDAKAILAIHHVFLTIWTSNWEPSRENTMPCITQRCLALLGMQADGSICDPNGSTSHMSRFEHVMRLTFLKEIHLLATNKYDGNFDLDREDLQPWFIEKVRSHFNTVK